MQQDDITDIQAKLYHRRLEEKLEGLKKIYGWHYEVLKTSWAKKPGILPPTSRETPAK
jgi:hypothetical protein